MLLFRLVLITLLSWLSKSVSVPSTRPPKNERTYESESIDNLIKDLKPLLKDPEIAQLFENCLPNTLDTTVQYTSSDPILDSFVITGDIEALWLRDSTNQVIPYVPYARDDAALRALLQGLIARHARSIIIDPFANAFNFNASSVPSDNHENDIRKPPMTPAVFEGKYEIDSLLAFVKLSYWYVKETDDRSVLTEEWFEAASTALQVIETMMYIGEGARQPYMFQRETTVATDTLSISGLGPPGKPGVGFSRSLFRPSDDAVTFPYNIPGNAMGCVEIRSHLSVLLGALGGDGVHALVLARAKQVGDDMCAAVDALFQEHATGNPLPYEVDGFGSRAMMDDANIPSLLSLPILGALSPTSDIYLTTRAFVLSKNNPFFFSGTAAEGVGGPHQGYAMAWPMAIAVRAMTSTSDEEIMSCLTMLKLSTAGTGVMHESFNVNDPHDYTRDWFAWANGLFGEMLLQLVHTHPHLVLRSGADARTQAMRLVRKPVSLLALEEAQQGPF